MNELVKTVVDHFLDKSIDNAGRFVEALADRIGTPAIREHLDAYDRARQDADEAEKKKFGGLKLFSKWIK